MASRLYGFGLWLMENAGGASGTSIRIKTSSSDAVSTASSLVTKRSPGSSMPPWHRPSWAPVGRCSGGSTPPLRTG